MTDSSKAQGDDGRFYVSTGGRAPTHALEPYDLAALLLVALLCIVAAFTVRDYGISNDEEVQHRYGELILAYYASGFTDRAVFTYKNLYLYGGLFDIVAVLLARTLPFDPYLIRHVLCAAIGIAGIAGVWATARLVAGPRAGFLAACAFAVTAVWYGAMFNHTKDIPFAAAMLWAVFFLLRIARDLPHPQWRDVLGFGALLGAACGLRAIGMLLVGYAGLVVLVQLAQVVRDHRAASMAFAARSAIRLAPGILLGYTIMLASWPWAAQDLLNPVRAIFAFAQFQYEIRTLLAGTVYTMSEVPRWYVPAYLVIKLPLLVLAAAVLAGVLTVTRTGLRHLSALGEARRAVWLLWFSVAFPVLAEVIGQGPAFTGMRHFYFVVPPLAVLAGIGLDTALAWSAARHRLAAPATAVALSAVLLWQASLIIRLHPHQYLYYNALVGGLPGAAGRYEMDYWVNIMPEAVTRLKALLDREGKQTPERPFTVGVCGERFSFENEADARMEWTGGWYEAAFFIAPTHMNCDHATNGNPVIKIERLGVLIGVVKDRRGYPSPAAPATP